MKFFGVLISQKNFFFPSINNVHFNITNKNLFTPKSYHFLMHEENSTALGHHLMMRISSTKCSKKTKKKKKIKSKHFVAKTWSINGIFCITFVIAWIQNSHARYITSLPEYNFYNFQIYTMRKKCNYFTTHKLHGRKRTKIVKRR